MKININKNHKPETKKNNSDWLQSLLTLTKKASKSKYKNLSKNHDQYLYENK